MTSVSPSSTHSTRLPFERKIARAPTPRKLYRAHFSPPSTDSSRKAVFPSSIFRKSERGVSRSARISRTTGICLPCRACLASVSNCSGDVRSTGPDLVASESNPGKPLGGRAEKPFYSRALTNQRQAGPGSARQPARWASTPHGPTGRRGSNSRPREDHCRTDCSARLRDP